MNPTNVFILLWKLSQPGASVDIGTSFWINPNVINIWIMGNYIFSANSFKELICISFLSLIKNFQNLFFETPFFYCAEYKLLKITTFVFNN